MSSLAGGYVVYYKVEASMRLIDPSGRVLIDRNYGALSGDMVADRYMSAAESRDGIGTYDLVCIRAVLLKASAEVFGMYGFGLMSAMLELEPVKEIKASKAATENAKEVLRNKSGLFLNENEKQVIRDFVGVIEKDINLASDKTRWIAYHDLSIGYALLQEEAKAKEYYAKEFEECRESIELVQNYLKPKSKMFFPRDMEKFRTYFAIEEFMKYYAAGANKYPELVSALSRPLKQFSDYYSHNDLLSQIFGMDMLYQFLPFNSFKGSPRSVSGTITIEGGKVIEYKLDMDKAGNAKALQVESVNEAGDKIVTKEMQPVFNEKGEYITVSIPGLERWLGTGTSKTDLRSMSAPVDSLTFGKAGQILRGDGMQFKTNEKCRMIIDLNGTMYFEGTNDYSVPNVFFSKFLTGSNTKFGKAKTSTDFSAITQIDANGVVQRWKWEGSAYMGWGVVYNADGTFSAKNTMEGPINRDFNVTDLDQNGNPKSITVTSSVTVKASSAQTDWKKVKEQYTSLSSYWATTGKPKVIVNANGFNASSTEIWPSVYTLDAKGNWTEAKMGPYTIKRVFKY
jgi:hypothetical protein